MAINVSQKFREVVYSGGAVYRCHLIINGEPIPQSEIKSIKISSPIIDTKNETFYLGTFLSQSLKIIFKNVNIVKDIKSGLNVELSIDLLVDGAYKNVPIGKYVIDDLAENYYSTNEITCLDYGVKCLPAVDYSPIFYALTQDTQINEEKKYYIQQGIYPDYKYIEVEEPIIENIGTYYENTHEATLEQILIWLCDHFNITLGTYPDVNRNVKTGSYDSTIGGKRYFSYIAEMMGGNVKMGRDGKLNIVPLFQPPTVTINAKKSKLFKYKEKYKISGVKYNDGIRILEAGNTNDNTLWIRQENMFVNNQIAIDNIYNTVNGFEIYSIENENYGDISLDCWDIIAFKLDDKIYNTLNHNDMTYEMTIMTKINSNIPSKQQEQLTNKVLGNNPDPRVRRAYSEINSVENTINVIVEDVNENSGLISQLQLEDSEIKATVSKQEERIGKNETSIGEIKVEAGAISQRVFTVESDIGNMYSKEDINKIVNGEGIETASGEKITVSAIIMTEGKFDKDGMHYRKTNAETESNINEKGMGVLKTSNNEEIMFAGYVNDDRYGKIYNGDSIVYTHNLVADGFANVGKNGRFEEFVDEEGHEGVGFFITGGQ